jgi:hypothetical protein
VSIIVLLGILGISWIFPPILYSVVIVVPLLILISSRSCYFKRIDDNDSGVLKYDEAFKIKGNIVNQYYDLRNLEIYPLFNAHDQKEPFSSVSPIFISKLSKESNEFEGYWLYEHCDNSYFASLDSVHLYDDEGNVVADIRLKYVSIINDQELQMKDLKTISKKQRIIGHCLPCVVIILIPFFDILLRYAFLGPLEKYPGLVGIIATVWIPISPSLLILSAIFSYRMARTHAIYDALMVVIYFFLSYLLYTIFVPDMALFMNYLPIKAACFGLTYVITRSVRK